MNFTYRWGERPLDGYTLKRGLGKGGFGEVYFALSDGGKEVALKLIRGQSETELRGIANCLNLKHPNLVHLYDMRSDARGDRWLVMEYIQGEPLSTFLQRYPHGLPLPQARDWFLQAARAVAFLHDHAIIHRDIKPANLFVEEGIIKLGDYGLSKSVGGSQHAQSSNVGTIHYMAPEVASGAYSKQIDIYACGVMLYEMLTGQLPFRGESWAEVAIKHQTQTPDLRKVPAEYVPILEKALNKNADRRFRDMSAMIRAVEAADDVSLITATLVEPTPTPPISARVQKAENPRLLPLGVSELIGSMFMVPFIAVPIAAVWALFTGSVQWGQLGILFLLMTIASWSVLLATRLWEGSAISQPRRLALGFFGGLIGIATYWLNGWVLPELWMQDEALPRGMVSYWGGVLRGEPGSLEVLAGFMIFFALIMMIPRWWLSAERRRRERFSLYPLFATGFWAFLAVACWKNFAPAQQNYIPKYLVLAIAGTAAVVQIVSAHEPPAPVRRNSRYRLGEGRIA